MRFLLLIITTLISIQSFCQSRSLVEVPIEQKSLKRVAIIIANQNYKREELSLKKTYNDADDMKVALEKLGFSILVFEKDMSFGQFNDKMKSLEVQLKGTDLVFFYFSGHGVEYNGENFLLPSDFPNLETISDIKKYANSLTLVYETLEKAKVRTKILAIDACRNQPLSRGFKTKTNLSGGLVLPKNAPAGTYTIFATKSKEVALENLDGRNSFFTQEFLKNIVIPNLTITSIYKETKKGVLQETNNKQDPSALDELNGEMIFASVEEKNIKPTDFKPKETNDPVQKLITDGKLNTNGSLKLKIKTNKGEGFVKYNAGEIMKVSFLINEPCYLRLIYRLADGQLVLLKENFQVDKSMLNKWQELSEEFECSSPFGYENLISFASYKPFSNLVVENKDGYDYIKSSIETVLGTTRGMKKNTQQSSDTIEDQIVILTQNLP